MELKRCKTCGGTVTRTRNYYICDYCGNEWQIDVSDDVHAVDRANAWGYLREGDFEKAAELFENIIFKDNNDHEAYWGKALADAAIMYVTDINENKKVPTCNNITEKSFEDDKNVKNAICLAPAEISETYRRQAQYIEKVRKEWFELASKEPDYDIFICFKDSDRENGIERTQDSIDAQELYTALVDEGYRVFFSRVSLRNKVAEQYEPYIYNAIKTSKVMIVFGEKTEYFSSVWMKNEWKRYQLMIEKGDKHKNSLIVVYKNISPNDLPSSLRSRQCMNASEMTFYSDLSNHVKRILDKHKEGVHLDRISIKGGQIGKKASSVPMNTVRVRNTGTQSVSSEISIDEKQALSLVYTFMRENEWSRANKIIENLLFDNPNCAEAIWCKLLSVNKAKNDQEFLRLCDFREKNLALLEKFLNCAPAELAKEKLMLLYFPNRWLSVTDEMYCRLLKTILPYSFDRREEMISIAFDRVIECTLYDSFKILIQTLDSAEIDKYIKYNLIFAQNSLDGKIKRKCLSDILAVDEGNHDALFMVVLIDLIEKRPNDEIIKNLKNLLIFSNDVKKDVSKLFNWLGESLDNKNQCVFAKELLRYYPGETKELENELTVLVEKMIKLGFFDYADYFNNIIIADDPELAVGYWNKCLIKLRVRDENKVVDSDIKIEDLPEFNKFLSLLDDFQITKYLAISRKQSQRINKLEAEKREEEYLEKQKRKKEERYKQLEKEEEEKKKKWYEEYERKKKARRKQQIKEFFIFMVILAIIVLGGYLAIFKIIPEKQYKNGVSLYNEGKYQEAAEVFDAIIVEYKDSKQLSKESYYRYAESLFQKKEYYEAANAFRKIEGYNDSADRKNESNYQYALSELNNGNYGSAESLFLKLGDYKDSAEKINDVRIKSRNSEINDVVQFGEYQWYIISKNSESMTLLCKDTICEKSYNDSYEYLTWESSFLRNWLNNEFYNSFSDDEKSIIMEKVCTNKKNSAYDTPGGNDTTDNIYLLSITEAKALNEDIRSTGIWWWLRSPGKEQDNAAFVGSDGIISFEGCYEEDELGVRPALTIRL